ncbi:hypothetical protein KVL44_04095 [Helicobacter pylori]|nr:hypothetical protein KVL44_04095 [Helicobacter pylori]
MTNKAKNNYTSSVLLKICCFRDRQKAKDLKRQMRVFGAWVCFLVVV